MKVMEAKYDALEVKTTETANLVASKVAELLEAQADEIKENLTTDIQKEVEKAVNDQTNQDELINRLKEEASRSAKADQEEMSSKFKEEAAKSIETELSRPELLNKVAREMADRERRRSNLILYGVHEIQEEDKETRIKADESRCCRIINFLDSSMDSNAIKRIRRLGKFTEGKNRPVLMELHNNKDKETILSQTRKLKGSDYDGVGVSHDLTNSQRKELQGLVAEAKSKSTRDKFLKVVGPPSFWKIQEKEPPR
jgi:hypothetical protein